MALIVCTNCGKKISDKAKECVHCQSSIQVASQEEEWNPFPLQAQAETEIPKTAITSDRRDREEQTNVLDKLSHPHIPIVIGGIMCFLGLLDIIAYGLFAFEIQGVDFFWHFWSTLNEFSLGNLGLLIFGEGSYWAFYLSFVFGCLLIGNATRGHKTTQLVIADFKTITNDGSDEKELQERQTRYYDNILKNALDTLPFPYVPTTIGGAIACLGIWILTNPIYGLFISAFFYLIIGSLLIGHALSRHNKAKNAIIAMVEEHKLKQKIKVASNM